MNLYDPDGLTMRANWVEDTRLGGRNDLAGYYAAITFIDDEIGRILAKLEETGQADNTIILLTSDHGDMLGSQGTYLKRKPWEESAQVPGILRYRAGVTAGRRLDLLFSHVDVVPTLLGLARIPAPEGIDGQDLSRYLFSAEQGGVEPDEQRPSSVYLQSYTPTEQDEFPPWRGVRTERHTYARNQDGPWMLYDNQQDPFQLDNLVDKPEHAELQSRLDAEVMAWFERSGDDWRERRDLPYR
jgi:arylsulfatase A-like enzyme